MALEKNKRFSSACVLEVYMIFPEISACPIGNTQIQYKKNKQIKVENIDCFRDKKHIKILIISRYNALFRITKQKDAKFTVTSDPRECHQIL